MPETIQGTIASIAILDDDADFRTYLEDFLIGREHLLGARLRQRPRAV